MSAPKSAEIAKGDEGRLMCSIGFIGLVIESTLPIPQFIANYKRKSCYGFRSSTLAGWLFGDLFKSVHFLLAAIHINLSLDGCTPLYAHRAAFWEISVDRTDSALIYPQDRVLLYPKRT